MLKLSTIRYMGIKTHLLDHILQAIATVTPKDGSVLDIMAGSNAVSYALKEFYTVLTNDVQEYSYVISKGVIENQTEVISKEGAKKDLMGEISNNKKYKYKTFFEDTYSSTYFSKEQCVDIDSIRYAISKVPSEEKQNLYLFALMCAMCKVQSTTGHFAQYMPSTHKRIIPLQKMDLLNEFFLKCDNYKDLYFSDKENKAYCKDFKDLLKDDLPHIDTIYLDSPYSQEQYSRFYHILETVVKYDSPKVAFKAKYRENRFHSDFCYKGKVLGEFAYIIEYCKTHKINLVISYSTNALADVKQLEELCKKAFSSVKVKEIDYKHSTQGKGANKIKEILIICAV